MAAGLTSTLGTGRGVVQQQTAKYPMCSLKSCKTEAAVHIVQHKFHLVSFIAVSITNIGN